MTVADRRPQQWAPAPAPSAQRRAERPQPEPCRQAGTPSRDRTPAAAPQPGRTPATRRSAATVCSTRDSAPARPHPAAPARPRRSHLRAGRAASSIPGISAVTQPARIGSAQEMQPGDLDVADALRMMLRVGASDLHLTTGAPPMVRLDGQLAALPEWTC